MTRARWAAGIAVLLRAAAWGACPHDCVLGGGPAATDCFVAFGGVASTTVTCADGDPSCDTDGAADGVCTFGLAACINVAGTSCAPAGLDAPPSVRPANSTATRALAAALGALDGGALQCTPPGFGVPLKVGVAGVKPGKAVFTVTAASGGKRDRDRVRLTCTAGAAPSFSAVIAPLLAARCATRGCHPSGGQVPALDEGAYAAIVNQRAVGLPSLVQVRPGSIKQSYLARKILGQGRILGALMPQGCPGFPPEGGCLSEAERFAILAWIQGGAPAN